jgi:DNA-binding SARP family transcriptional activator
MGLSLSPEQDGSTISFIERGLECIRQGHSPEAVTFFALARERLSPEQARLAAVLDTFTQGYIRYWQAEQTLHQASKYFAEVDAERQEQIAALEKVLLTLLQDKDRTGVVGSADSIAGPLARHLVGVSPGSAQFRQDSNSTGHKSAQLPSLTATAKLLQDVNSQVVDQPGEESAVLPALYFTCFGRFEVERLGQPVVLCSNRNGQAILRYLLTQPGYRATMDMLMEALWPDDEPEAAHHKVQVAISALRRSLNSGYTDEPGGGYILCRKQVYQLNPLVQLRSDVDEFLEWYQAGHQTSGSAMAAHYERACDLYTGPYLLEDLYSDWSFARREQLSRAYLTMCGALAEHYLEAGSYEDAMKWATALLKENHCDEAAHRLLMRVYAAQGRRNEALRQYERCKRVLLEELGAQPMPETVNLFQSILTNEKISSKWNENRTKIEP